MKSCKVLLIAICYFVFISLNAQVFVGGNAGLSNIVSLNAITIGAIYKF